MSALRATIEQVTQDNQALIRSYHPHLAPFDEVIASTDESGRSTWRIHVDSGFRQRVPTGNLGIEAAGRTIQIIPLLKIDPVCSSIFLSAPDPIPRTINPRKFLTGNQLRRVRDCFPTSSGVMMFVSGYIVLLYETESDMNRAWTYPPICTIGGLTVQHSIDNRKPSVVTAESGVVIRDSDPASNMACIIGLKLKLRDGTEGITTVTHGFVRQNRSLLSLKLPLYGWYSRLTEALSTFSGIRQPPVPAFIKASSTASLLSNSPMGKEASLVETNENLKVSHSISLILARPVSFRPTFGFFRSVPSELRMTVRAL